MNKYIVLGAVASLSIGSITFNCSAQYSLSQLIDDCESGLIYDALLAETNEATRCQSSLTSATTQAAHSKPVDFHFLQLLEWIYRVEQVVNRA